jgi:hypothetical protein
MDLSLKCYVASLLHYEIAGFRSILGFSSTAVVSRRNAARLLDESLCICLSSWFTHPRDDNLLD